MGIEQRDGQSGLPRGGADHVGDYPGQEDEM